jgi:hypothetical protein
MKIPWVKKHCYHFVEFWVMGHTLLALFLFILGRNIPTIPKGLVIFFLAYGFLRIFEMTVYQVNVLLFDPYRKPDYAVNSYRRLVILLFHNYVEVILWFAGSYTWLANLGLGILPPAMMGSWFSTFMYSFLTMVGFGANSISEYTLSHLTPWHTVLLLQAIIGLFMTIVCLARFISLLPAPDTQNPEEQKAEEQELSQELTEVKQKLTDLQMALDRMNEKLNRQEEETIELMIK